MNQSRTVLVTGGNRGIGFAIAEEFVVQGYKVAVTARSGQGPTGSLTVRADVTDGASLDAALLEVEQQLGPIEVLVANAGITRDTLLMRMSEEQWDEVIRVNLKSVFNLSKAVIKPMLKARSGSIINMSSVVGVQGNAGQANYAASKAGILGFTKSMAAELGSRNIRCNAIAPGFIETEMTAALDEKVVQQWRDTIPLKRGGTTNDVAQATLFLASDMSAYITGQTLHVCGGMLM